MLTRQNKCCVIACEIHIVSTFIDISIEIFQTLHSLLMMSIFEWFIKTDKYDIEFDAYLDLKIKYLKSKS